MKILPFTSVLVLFLLLISCSPKSFVRRGDKLVSTGRYFRAQKLYEKAYKKQKDPEKKADVAFKAASCFDRINLPRKASSWYRKAILNRDTFSNAVLNLAFAEVKNRRFDYAEENFWEYVDLHPEIKKEDDPSKILKRIADWEEFPGRYKVKILRDFNSSSSDFTPVFMGKDTNVIFFSSTRKIKGRPKKDRVTGDYFSNIYESHYSNEVIRTIKKKKGRKRSKRKSKRRSKKRGQGKRVVVDTYQWSKPRHISDSINTLWNEGALYFSSDGSTMYFTSSRKVNRNNLGTKIFTVQRNDGEWGEASMLNVVPDSLSAGHPSISSDGSVLYFVSDMPGGYGGNDIWMSKKEGGGWSEPQNLGKTINTPHEELFPFIRDNGNLYFASDRKGGMGGLDIYKAKMPESDKWQVENMKYPINSNTDDFAIVFQPGKEKGMFTSSRRRGNDDIYRFDYIPLQFSILGKILNSETKEPVSNAQIHVVSSDGEQKELKADKTGDFSIELKPGAEYIIMALSEGYLNGKELADTRELDVSRNFTTVIELKPIEKPIELPNILYDFGSWKLRKESMVALDALVETLNDNPNITIELGSHSDFIGSENTNKEVSQKRAQAVVDYLIEKGIYWDRLMAHGYGESQPRTVTKDIAEEHDFLAEQEVLTEEKITKMKPKEKDIANQLNRRTEFKVLSTTYKPGPHSKIKPDINSNQIGNTLIKELADVKGVFYTIQIGAFDKNTIPHFIQDFKVVFRDLINESTFRYTTGIFDDLEEAETEAKNISEKGLKAFVVAYYKGKKVSFTEAEKVKE